MRVRRAGSIVVEMINHQACAVGGELDVELVEQGDERSWGCCTRAQSYEDVPFGIDEVNEEVRSQVGAEAWQRL